MAKRKRRRTAAEKEERKRRKAEYRTVIINGKQKRIRREPTIDGLPVEEFLRRNAGPIFLHQMEMWWLIPTDGQDVPANWAQLVEPEEPYPPDTPEPEWDPPALEDEDDLPF